MSLIANTVCLIITGSLLSFSLFWAPNFPFFFYHNQCTWYGTLVAGLVASLRALQPANPLWAYTIALSECSVVIWVAVPRSFLGRVQWPADLLLNPEGLDWTTYGESLMCRYLSKAPLWRYLRPSLYAKSLCCWILSPAPVTVPGTYLYNLLPKYSKLDNVGSLEGQVKAD